MEVTVKFIQKFGMPDKIRNLEAMAGEYHLEAVPDEEFYLTTFIKGSKTDFDTMMSEQAWLKRYFIIKY